MTVHPPNEPPPELPDDDAEEALNWDSSSRDASYVEGPAPVRQGEAAPPAAVRAQGASAGGAADASDAPPAVVPTSPFLLVTYGIVAGIFLLYAIGWFTSVRRGSYVDPSVLGTFMTGLGQVLAVVAAPVWFGAVFLLTRHSKPISRLLCLLLGLVLLVPIPFVMGV